MAEHWWARACDIFPGGVNSPVRAFAAVGETPFFVSEAKGAWLTDSEGRRYIDYVGSWGPMIMGHAHDDVVAAVQAQAEKGLSYGTPNPLEVLLAEVILARIPCLQSLRFVNSGTEATMSALRLARAYKQRQGVIKFAGCYHGHVDALLVEAGSGLLTHGLSSSSGVGEAAVQNTFVATYNDLDSVERLLKAHGERIASVIVEPVAGNMNLILPHAGFLQGLRQLCDRYDVLLIFDEVMTGFRVHGGGATMRYGVEPDMMTLGKVMGGGLPAAAYAASHAIMCHVSPAGGVYQAGTLSGNPLAMAAGLATLQLTASIDYEVLQQRAQRLLMGIQALLAAKGQAFSFRVLGGFFGFVLSEHYPERFVRFAEHERRAFARFFQQALSAGVYFAPSMYEAGFISWVHDEAIIDETLARLAKVL